MNARLAGRSIGNNNITSVGIDVDRFTVSAPIGASNDGDDDDDESRASSSAHLHASAHKHLAHADAVCRRVQTSDVIMMRPVKRGRESLTPALRV